MADKVCTVQVFGNKLYNCQKRPKLQGFHLYMIPEVIELATNVTSCGLEFCCAGGTTVEQFFMLPYLITPVVLGNFLTFFPTFRNFSPQKQHFCASKSRNNGHYNFCRLFQGSRLLLHQLSQGYFGLMEHTCSNHGGHRKTRKNGIFAENMFSSLESVP